MTKLTLDRVPPRAKSALAAFALAVASLFELGAKGTGGMNIWPVVGIVAVLIVAFLASRFVRGDPYYERNAGRDRRDSGATPLDVD